MSIEREADEAPKDDTATEQQAPSTSDAGNQENAEQSGGDESMDEESCEDAMAPAAGGEDLFLVERVLNMRFNATTGKKEYYLKWKNFTRYVYRCLYCVKRLV